MARTHTFKGSASAGYGWSAFIEDGSLVIEYNNPREGGAVYMGNYEGATDYWLNRIKTEDLVLYEDIEKYFIKHGISDDLEDLKKKYSFDEETKTILFKVKLHMDNLKTHEVLVRGRSQSGVVDKLMPKIPEVLMLQTLDAREFAVRSNKIDAVEFLED